jgi:hypothetical protein
MDNPMATSDLPCDNRGPRPHKGNSEMPAGK